MSMWWSVNGSNWQAISIINEFAAGHNDDCGPCANENLMAWLNHRAPSATEMNAIRTRDLNAGHFTNGGGQGIADIAWDIENEWHWAGALVSLKPYHESYSAEDLRAACQAVDQHAGHGGVIVEIGAARNLPFNEPGVNYHFVAVLGYDQAADKVYIANGDRTPLPGGTGKPDWLTVAQVAAADICGIVTVLQQEAPVPTTAEILQAHGWKDSTDWNPATNGILTAPNGKSLQHGFRADALTHGWDPADMPLEDEEGGVWLLAQDHRWGKGNRQICALHILVWVPDDVNTDGLVKTSGVYRVAAGTEALFLSQHPETITQTVTQTVTEPGPDNSAAIAKLTDLVSQLTEAIGEVK